MDATFEDELDWDDVERREAVEAVSQPPPTQAAEELRATEESSGQTRKRLRREISPLSPEAAAASDASAEEDNAEDAEDQSSANAGPKSRLAGRVVRAKLVPKRNIDPKQFGIESEELKEITITDEQSDAVYRSLGVDARNSTLRLHSLLLKGVDGMSTFDITKIFAEYGPPDSVRFVDATSCVVRWHNAAEAAQILLDMTRPLVRIRSAKVPEEGELSGSEEEEEGQVKEENGDDVAVVKSGPKQRKKRLESLDVVEIDVETVKIPEGKWRVIVRHVPENRLLLARIATGYEVRLSVTGSALKPSTEQKTEAATKRGRFDEDGYEYKWSVQQEKVRPGLNVFDDKGQELDWDYEHDTRFYENASSDENEERATKESNDREFPAASSSVPVETVVGGRQIRSRGRGAKKFFAFASKSSDEDSDAEQV